MRGGRAYAIGILMAAAVLGAATARADSIEVLMEKRSRKSTSVLTLRQGFDTLHGFDLYFLETFSSPKRKKLSERQLAADKRDVCIKLGQFELYMKKVEAAKTRALRRLEKKGFEPVCRLVRLDVPSIEKVALPTGENKLSLYVKRDRLVLETEDGKSKTLKRFKKPKKPKKPKGKKSSPYVAHRGIMEASLVRGGKTLAVVVRKQTLPSPEYFSDDDLFLIPLRKPLKRVGVKYPLACPQPEPGTEQEP